MKAPFLTVLILFLWSQISSVDAAEIDDLHSEIVAIEIFVEDYEIAFKSEMVDAIPQRIDNALISVGSSVSAIRSNSSNSLNESYTAFCLELDTTRDARQLAAEIDGLTIDVLRGRKRLLGEALVSAGLDTKDVDAVELMARFSVGRNIVNDGPTASSLRSAQLDPDTFKKVLSAGCTSHLENDHQEPEPSSDADRSFGK